MEILERKAGDTFVKLSLADIDILKKKINKWATSHDCCEACSGSVVKFIVGVFTEGEYLTKSPKWYSKNTSDFMQRMFNKF